MAHENQMNHCKIYLRKVDTTKDGWPRTRPSSDLVIFKMRGLEYNYMGHSSSLSINTGRLYLRTGLWRLGEEGKEHSDWLVMSVLWPQCGIEEGQNVCHSLPPRIDLPQDILHPQYSKVQETYKSYLASMWYNVLLTPITLLKIPLLPCLFLLPISCPPLNHYLTITTFHFPSHSILTFRIFILPLKFQSRPPNSALLLR